MSALRRFQKQAREVQTRMQPQLASLTVSFNFWGLVWLFAGLRGPKEVERALMRGHGGNLWKLGPLSQGEGEWQGSELGLLLQPPHPICRTPQTHTHTA